MGPLKINAKRKDTKVKVGMEQGRSQRQHRRKNPDLTPRPNISGACRALTGQNFSGNHTKNFKATLDNISIYDGATYGHKMGMTLKARNKAVIQQSDNPNPNMPIISGSFSAKTTSSAERS